MSIEKMHSHSNSDRIKANLKEKRTLMIVGKDRIDLDVF